MANKWQIYPLAVNKIMICFCMKAACSMYQGIFIDFKKNSQHLISSMNDTASQGSAPGGPQLC